MTIRLPLHLKQMGAPQHCAHRAGWRFVLENLQPLHRPGAPILDDFVERTFQHEVGGQSWLEPWVGIFHHPPNFPAWLDSTAPLPTIISTPRFVESRPWLRGAVALSEHLGAWLRTTLKVPVEVVRHPTEVPAVCFSQEDWARASQKKLVQIGWYGRNYRGIYQVRVPANFRKIRVVQDVPWVHAAAVQTDSLSPFRHRRDYGEVELVPRLSDGEYDQLLADSVVFCEYFDVSASNTIIECIARNTPVIVNRLAAIEEYLGPDYPLYFNTIDDVCDLLANSNNIVNAHEHLKNLDKTWLSPRTFADRVLRFVQEVIPIDEGGVPPVSVRPSIEL